MKIDAGLVKSLRMERGWTQQHLADACDLSMRTVQRVEHHGVASPDTLMSLSAVLEVERGQLELHLRPDAASLKPVSPYRRMAFIAVIALAAFVMGMTAMFVYLQG